MQHGGLQIDWRALTVACIAIGILALAVSWLVPVPIVPIMAVLLVAVVANGVLATLEDDLPGGFNNPDGTDTPRYARYAIQVARVVKWFFLAGLCLLGAALALASLEPDADRPFAVGLGMACVLFAGSLFKQSRWALWAALLVGLGGLALSALGS